ncbi:hypothetical protein GE21DRAFT_1052518 [Neurospora crassa]|nr:hypothetical protein GE21DRAFT_1052518 [Neurospora crassa]
MVGTNLKTVLWALLELAFFCFPPRAPLQLARPRLGEPRIYNTFTSESPVLCPLLGPLDFPFSSPLLLPLLRFTSLTYLACPPTHSSTQHSHLSPFACSDLRRGSDFDYCPLRTPTVLLCLESFLFYVT